ncbi:MAG: hypothetical protein Q4Q25_04685 [Methanocorpusculum sp.]|nr:hypothetical protein [Methanocorpusculum sp.]
MAGKVIGKSMNYGYAGNYARTPDDIVADRKLAVDSAAIPFGNAVALKADNTYTAVDENFTATAFAGIALRTVKQATSYQNQNIVEYQPGEMMSALERGAATVVCNVGTPTAGGPVFIRIKANAAVPNGVVGGFEAQADAGNTVQLPNAKWTNGYVDANKVAEVTLLTRVNP